MTAAGRVGMAALLFHAVVPAATQQRITVRLAEQAISQPERSPPPVASTSALARRSSTTSQPTSQLANLACHRRSHRCARARACHAVSTPPHARSASEVTGRVRVYLAVDGSVAPLTQCDDSHGTAQMFGVDVLVPGLGL